MRARLLDGSVVRLEKECDCLPAIHESPHWVHMDETAKRLNARLLERGNLHGFVMSESARLTDLVWQMERRGISELLP